MALLSTSVTTIILLIGGSHELCPKSITILNGWQGCSVRRSEKVTSLEYVTACRRTHGD